MKTPAKVNSKALFRHCYEIMMDLKSNKISTEEAKAQSNLVKQSNNLLRYELDRAIAKEKFEGIELREIEDQKE